MAIHEDARRGGLRNRYELRNRYVFEGKLIMQTALHIGGGRVTLSNSDSPVVLTPDQQPFIPGSSFKGALRSTVEKIVPSLPAEAHLSSCALIERSQEEVESEFGAGDQWPAGVCPTVWQSGLNRLKRNAGQERETTIALDAQANLCNTCLLFGSPFAAARLNVSDLYMPQGEWNGVIQTRDGVAIDRDSEKAKDRLKYDFEVVPASAIFDLKLVLENATAQDLQLLCVGLSEFVNGVGVIGGKRSRGLGVSRLEDLQVSALELDDPKIDRAIHNKRLQNYLVRGEFSETFTGPDFLQKHIDAIFG